MDALDKLDQAIREKLSAAELKRKNYAAIVENEMLARKDREDRFVETADRLINEVIRPRVAKVMGYFSNSQPLATPDAVSKHCRYQLEHSALFPATAKLDVSLGADRAFDNLIVGYDLEILPLFIKFNGHDQLVLKLDDVRAEEVAAWVDSRLIDLVEVYLRIADADEYADTALTDPVCGMPVRRSLGIEAIVSGHSYWFCAESCREKFIQHPEAYVAGRRAR